MKKLLLLLILIALIASACKEKPPEQEASSSEIVSSSSSVASSNVAIDETPTEDNLIIFPVGGIGTSNFIDHERATYDGTMYLEVPRMGFKGIVLDGTTSDVLKDGVGFFPEAQLPGIENRNVCIAGHRDIEGGPFMDIDKITNGDLFYLTYQNKRYVYEYVETIITEPDDWTAIRVKEYSAITLQSCDPPWVLNSKRIFAMGKLISVEDVGGEDATKPAA